MLKISQNEILGSTRHFMIIFNGESGAEETKVEVLGWLVDASKIKKFITREFPDHQNGYCVYVVLANGHWELLGTDQDRSKKHFRW